MASHSRAGHRFENTNLYDRAQAVFGDQYLTNVYAFAALEHSPEARRHAILTALSYEGMNTRRNQLEDQKTRHLEWIWQASPFQGIWQTSHVQVSPLYNSERLRQQLSRSWGFPEDDDKIWHAIHQRSGCDLYELCTGHRSPGFVEWLNSDSPLFWISGKPASGKSSLMKYLASHENCLRYLATHTGLEWVLLHFFFDFRAQDGLANSLSGMFRSLLLQMIQQLPTAGVALQTHTLSTSLALPHNTLSLAEMRSLLQDCIKTTNNHICVFVDGLDEFTGSYSDLIETLTILADGVHVKICMASRPEPEIQLRLARMPSLRLQDYNQSSIAKYAYDVLSDLGSTHLEPAELWSLTARIATDASGVFLWTSLVCRDVTAGLLAQESQREIVMRIDTYPSSLDDVYDRLFQKMDQRSRIEAVVILRLLITYPLETWKSSPSLRDLLCITQVCRALNILPTFPSHTPDPKTFKLRLLCRLGGFIDTVNVQGDDHLYTGEDPGLTEVRLAHKTIATYLDTSPLYLNALSTRLAVTLPWSAIHCDYIESIDLSHVQLSTRADDNALQTSRLLRHTVKQLLTSAEVFEGRPFTEHAELDARTFAILTHGAATLHILDCTDADSCRCVRYHQLLTEPDVSKEEIAALVCVSHGAWRCLSQHMYAMQNPKVKAICGRFLIDTMSRHPSSLTELDKWIDVCKDGMSYTDILVSATDIALGYELYQPEIQLTSRIIAKKRCVPWQNIGTLALTEGRECCRYNLAPYSNLIQRLQDDLTHLSRRYSLCVLDGLRSSSYASDLLSLCLLYGSISGLLHMKILPEPIRPGEDLPGLLFDMLSWLRLYVFAGQNINIFCYPNGTILHLVVQLILERRYEAVWVGRLIRELIEVGVDPRIEGPMGTALRLARERQQQLNAAEVTPAFRARNCAAVIEVLEATYKLQTPIDVSGKEWMKPEWWLSFTPYGYEESGKRTPT